MTTEHEQRADAEAEDARMSALDDDAAVANNALTTLNNVLSKLPQTRGRDTAAHYLATTTLWIQQAFREAEK